MTVYNDYSHLTMSHLEQFDMTEEGALLRYCSGPKEPFTEDEGPIASGMPSTREDRSFRCTRIFPCALTLVDVHVCSHRLVLYCFKLLSYSFYSFMLLSIFILY